MTFCLASNWPPVNLFSDLKQLYFSIENQPFVKRIHATVVTEFSSLIVSLKID